MSVLHLNDCHGIELCWQDILCYERCDLNIFISDEEVPHWAHENNTLELFQISCQDIYYCADCFLDTLINLRTEFAVQMFVTECLIHREADEVKGEDIIQHIEDHCDFTDFCSICGRWSFVFISDTEYYNARCVNRAESEITHQLFLHSYHYECEQ
jgi:hypothetical protein